SPLPHHRSRRLRAAPGGRRGGMPGRRAAGGAAAREGPRGAPAARDGARAARGHPGPRRPPPDQRSRGRGPRGGGRRGTAHAHLAAGRSAPSHHPGRLPRGRLHPLAGRGATGRVRRRRLRRLRPRLRHAVQARLRATAGAARAGAGRGRAHPSGDRGGRPHPRAGAGGAGRRRGRRRGDPRHLRRGAAGRADQGLPRRARERLMADALHVAVIGGGIIGTATALGLAKRGCRVTLLERGTPGGEASSAAAGLLAPLGDSPDPSPFNRLAIESWRLYPRVVAELREVTGVDVEHVTKGTLYLLASRADVEDARARTGWPLAAEFGVEVVEGAALAALEPALSKDVTAALLVRGDHWVNNQRLVTAYALAAAARGATVRSGVEVGRILVERGRAVGVLADGERLTADAVLLAAGAWSGALASEL